jgi:hypothetical protein
VRLLPDLPRSWPANELPGYREHPTGYGTYSGFAYDELPPIARKLDNELRWLLGEPTVPASLADVDEAASTPATVDGLRRVAGAAIMLPPALVTFIGSDEPRARVRSCTDCYLDLGDFAVPVTDGGTLIHFLSDSQWVLHWLLYVSPEGPEAVVATNRPLGFELGEDEEGETLRLFDPASGDAAVCAESFTEFLYRFWIENEIWFKLANPDDEPRGLTPEQLRYAEHYARRPQP